MSLHSQFGGSKVELVTDTTARTGEIYAIVGYNTAVVATVVDSDGFTSVNINGIEISDDTPLFGCWSSVALTSGSALFYYRA